MIGTINRPILTIIFRFQGEDARRPPLLLNHKSMCKAYAVNGWLIRMRRNAKEEVSGTPPIK